MREARWEKALEAVLHRIPVTERTATTMKSAPWKVAVAAHLKGTTDVPNNWLAEKLSMGSGIYVSKYVGLLRRQRAGSAADLLRRIER